MPTHVALLRGINVGGRNRVAMADLREVVLGLGHTEVATYIQSGNVVFTSEEADSAAVAAALATRAATTRRGWSGPPCSWTPRSLGRSELAAQLTRLGGSRTVEAAGTARNWATVNKLLALCDG
jgi:uncharacterized protein (DUF1697 family)